MDQPWRPDETALLRELWAAKDSVGKYVYSDAEIAVRLGRSKRSVTAKALRRLHLGHRPMPDDKPWNDHSELRLLHELWAEKHPETGKALYSVSKIADKLGRSKNSVMGKIHRLKLDPRPAPANLPPKERPIRVAKERPIRVRDVRILVPRPQRDPLRPPPMQISAAPPPRPMPVVTRPTDEQEVMMWNLQSEGLKHREIAATCGVGRDVVVSVLGRETWIAPQPQEPAPEPPPHVPDRLAVSTSGTFPVEIAWEDAAFWAKNNRVEPDISLINQRRKELRLPAFRIMQRRKTWHDPLPAPNVGGLGRP